MIESLSLFASAIAVGTLIAVTLSLYGVHLATRDAAVQSMAVCQGAQLGVLLALGLTHHDGHHEAHRVWPWLIGVLVALCVSASSEKIASRVRTSKNAIFIVFFLVLLASSYCLVSVLPMLDSHHSQAFFGDLVYLAGMEMYIGGAISLLALLTLIANHRKWSEKSFLFSTFGRDSLIRTRNDQLFAVAALLLIVTSVFSVGLLLTLSALFIPTTLMRFQNPVGLGLHVFSCALVAGLGVLAGFVLTLKLGDYPTVPVVVLTFLVFGLIALFLIRLFLKKEGNQ